MTTSVSIITRREVREMTEKLREDIGKELEKHMQEVENKYLVALGGYITDVVEDEVGAEVSLRVAEEARHAVAKSIDHYWRHGAQTLKRVRIFQEKLKIRYRIPYATMIVVGFFLFWHGASGAISVIPYFEHWFVTMPLGMALLVITGAVYKKLVGV
jgi:uncharacterized protein YejL (UPF0352 family)